MMTRTIRRSFENYNDVREMLDAALANDKYGVAECESYGKAINLRARMNQFRTLDRDLMKEVYPRDHPQHGLSAYDALSFTIPPNSNRVIIKPRDFGVVKFTPGPPKEESQP